MADGSTVEIDPAQPLPPAVLADVTAPAQAIEDALPAKFGETPADPDPNRDAWKSIPLSAHAASDATGREVVFVYRTWGISNTKFEESAEPWAVPAEWLWSATRGADLPEALPDSATIVAQVEAFIARSDTPTSFDVIVLH